MSFGRPNSSSLSTSAGVALPFASSPPSSRTSMTIATSQTGLTGQVGRLMTGVVMPCDTRYSLMPIAPPDWDRSGPNLRRPRTSRPQRSRRRWSNVLDLFQTRLACDAKRVAIEARHDGALEDHDELALRVLNGLLERLFGRVARCVHDRFHVVHRQDVENDGCDVGVLALSRGLRAARAKPAVQPDRGRQLGLRRSLDCRRDLRNGQLAQTKHRLRSSRRT